MQKKIFEIQNSFLQNKNIEIECFWEKNLAKHSRNSIFNALGWISMFSVELFYIWQIFQCLPRLFWIWIFFLTWKNIFTFSIKILTRKIVQIWPSLLNVSNAYPNISLQCSMLSLHHQKKEFFFHLQIFFCV